MTRVTRAGSMHKAAKNQKDLVSQSTSIVAELEEKLKAALSSGEVKEGSRIHLEVKREIKKMRDSINLSRRRCP